MSESLFEAPSLIWDTMLNMANVEPELISDTELYIFFQKDVRDGISYISKRCTKANNKYLNPCQQ